MTFKAHPHRMLALLLLVLIAIFWFLPGLALNVKSDTTDSCLQLLDTSIPLPSSARAEQNPVLKVDEITQTATCYWHDAAGELNVVRTYRLHPPVETVVFFSVALALASGLVASGLRTRRRT